MQVPQVRSGSLKTLVSLSKGLRTLEHQNTRNPNYRILGPIFFFFFLYHQSDVNPQNPRFSVLRHGIAIMLSCHIHILVFMVSHHPGCGKRVVAFTATHFPTF